MMILVQPMREVPIGLKPRLRELTIGPVAWGLWSLTFHDGSTYCAIAYAGDKQCAEDMIGWACLTEEYDKLPMVGAYVPEEHRRKGIGATLVTTLMRALLGDGTLYTGATIVASTSRWGQYYDLLDSCGLICEEWV